MKNGPTILHIEDTDYDHMLFKHDLAKLGFQGEYVRMESFAAAKRYLDEALASSQRSRRLPDLIIADSRIGCYNGLEVVQWLKGDTRLRQVPVAVFSTSVAPTLEQQILKAGAVACLTKPIDMEENIAAVRQLLRLAERPAQA